MSIEKQEIMDGLKPLFEKAEKKNLWFYSTYQDAWYTPKELRKCYERITALQKAVDWELRDPRCELTNRYNKVKGAQLDLDNWKQKLKDGGFEI